MQKINIFECGPRDGWQNLKQILSTEQKLKYIDGLFACGIHSMEITSFVSPRAIPQMADAGEVARRCAEKYPIPYEGNRFPTEYYDQLMMQSVPRWLTSDEWTIDAYAKYIERMQERVDGVIIMAHSQAGPYAQKILQKYPDFVKALILIEPAGLPGPDEDLSAFAKVPQLYVYGDFMSDEYKIVHSWVDSVRKNIPQWRASLDEINADYTWMSLPDMGIKGNSHMLMMDNNNDQIAGLINDWIIEKGLCNK